MAKQCDICSRTPRSGQSRSHSNIASKRTMSLNLQKQTIDGKKMLVCTSCIKNMKKKKKKA